jgi:hypothetical protein
MGRFWNFLSNSNAPDGKLPLIHTTDLFCFRQIRNNEKLQPMECDVYKGEKLLYFFYGRPSYRPHGQKQTITAKAFLPVCFVMSREFADCAMRIMPFDTGAFSRKMMHPPMHEAMKLEEFELVADSNAPMRIVKIFYETEYNYYRAHAKPSVENYDEFDDLEIDSYFRLLHHRANTEFDDRVTAIEIQLNSSVILAGYVHAVILPKPYLGKHGIAQQVEKWGGIAIPYNVKEEFIPREVQGAIFDRLTDFFEQKGFLERK